MFKSVFSFSYRLFLWVEKLFQYLAMGMLASMVAIICYQVALRFFLNISPSWTEEIAIVLMIWFGMLSIPIGVRLNLHIGIEYLFNHFPSGVKTAAARFIFLLIGIFGALMVVYGMELVGFMSMSTLPATKLPTSVEYIVIPVSGALLIFTALEKLFVKTDWHANGTQNPENASLTDINEI